MTQSTEQSTIWLTQEAHEWSEVGGEKARKTDRKARKPDRG